ncbi:MAG: hypothetical protein GY950_28910 [bacterium]|nr:hypothetical protein [bacterium]
MSISEPEIVHVWNHCHHCGAAPIVGLRYNCGYCPDGPDNDFCENCYEKYQKGEVQHPAEGTPASLLGIPEHRFEAVEGKSLSLYRPWLGVSQPVAADPGVGERFVVRPLFSSGLDTVMGGYAFAVTVEDARYPLLLTALHIMDEIIKKKGIDCTGRNSGYTGRELPAVISGVDIYDVFAPNWMTAHLGTAGPMLVLPGARTGDEEPNSVRDIAAFWLKDAGDLNPAPLAGHAPVAGEPVWLTARHEDNTGNRTFKAVVVEINHHSMVFKYETPGEIPKYSSGAPVINQSGEVVGIAAGGGKVLGCRVGHANHVGNIRAHLGAAIAG